jgi:ABC-type branched-subunit amino acid transport system ATPase component
MLQVDQLHAFYGPSQVLHGVTFAIQPGEIVALLGRNGAGRSTTAKALMGLVRCAGSVRWQGTELVGQPPFAIAQRGLGYVAEGRDIFPRLTVQQNLLLAQGIAVLLIEQKQTLALAQASRVLVLGQGRVVFGGTPQALAANASVRQQWLEI